MIFLQGTYDEIKEIAPTYINLKKLGITIYFWYNVSCQIYS